MQKGKQDERMLVGEELCYMCYKLFLVTVVINQRGMEAHVCQDCAVLLGFCFYFRKILILYCHIVHDTEN